MKLTMLHSAMPTKTCSRASLHISFTQTSHCVFHINSKQVNPHFTDRYFRLKLKGTWYYVCHAATCGHTVIKGQDHTKTTVREQGTGLVRSWKDRIHHPNLCSKFQTQRCKWVEFPRFLLCFKRFSPLLQFSPHQKKSMFHLISFDSVWFVPYPECRLLDLAYWLQGRNDDDDDDNDGYYATRWL